MFENSLDSLERCWYKDRKKERKEVRKDREKEERKKEIKLKTGECTEYGFQQRKRKIYLTRLGNNNELQQSEKEKG